MYRKGSEGTEKADSGEEIRGYGTLDYQMNDDESEDEEDIMKDEVDFYFFILLCSSG